MLESIRNHLLTPSVAVVDDEDDVVKKLCSRLLLVSVRRNDFTPKEARWRKLKVTVCVEIDGDSRTWP